ncbi:hypothetical protein B0H14DRAFT_2709414 [Mycena olivaceomarginata]|nr:hypothetical protein B0H14DRAFT_2709414 [Mycena olivaceomarginata]
MGRSSWGQIFGATSSSSSLSLIKVIWVLVAAAEEARVRLQASCTSSSLSDISMGATFSLRERFRFLLPSNVFATRVTLE